MANEDEEVIIDNRIEVLVDAMANPNVDVDGIEPQSDIEVLLLRVIRTLRNLQFTSSADTAAFVEELAKKANKTDIKDPVWGVITGQITNQTDLNDALNALQEAITALNTAMSNKANLTDIKDPVWGQIEGSLANQTDLTNALSGKASISDLAAVDTRTRNLESSVADKASKTEVNAKANTTDVNAALDLKADTSWTNAMLATKASTDALNEGLALKANTADVETAVGQLGQVINSKADASELESLDAAKADKPRKYTVSVPTSGWSGSSFPYTCNLTVSGVIASDDFDAKLKLATNLTADQVTQQKKNFAYIWNGKTVANQITLYAEEKPTVAMSIEFRQVI